MEPKARAAFIAASPNEVEATRNMSLACEGRSIFKKSIPGAVRTEGGGGDSCSLPRPQGFEASAQEGRD
ncbi:MAG TPA: hypothetical protein PKY20_03085 [Methanothrix sp.]|nr:hypothetical protein [Methanothrix sp.]